MKTAEEIKKGLECCGKNSGDPCRGCPYERTIGDAWTCEMTHDALAIIQQLEAQLEQVTRERDAYLKSIEGLCAACKKAPFCILTPVERCKNWQWKGVEVEG